MLEHFGALMCIGNPTVNSYCRMWDTGFWAPIYKNWGWQNRTTTVRVATGGRFEYRGVDSSCNPYMTTAALLQAGLDGVRRKLDPGPPQQGNTYDLLQQGVEIERVPESLGAALDALAKDELIQAAIPGRLYKVFDWYKRDEWERYLAAVTDWERNEYLEVLPVVCGIAGIIYRNGNGAHRLGRRHDPDAPVDEAPRPRLDRVRAVPPAERAS